MSIQRKWIALSLAGLCLVAMLFLALGHSGFRQTDGVLIVPGSSRTDPATNHGLNTFGPLSSNGVEKSSSSSIADPAVTQIMTDLRSRYSLSADDVIKPRSQAGNFYLLDLYPRAGGGGFWTIARLENGKTVVVLSGQDDPACDAPGLSDVPYELLQNCFSTGDNPYLVDRRSGTVVGTN